MDSYIQHELDSCIVELYSIARELENVANEIRASIQGMNTNKYTKDLEKCADKYRKAARRLEKIH
ncbi:hypothetical protein P261_00348 [Lachnospiraceae bacterium TWA4]|nr:hypothetical protein P261_00348 [Lachnospiraceae bacterium TWA4]